MVDKAGVGEKWISQKWLSNETNNKPKREAQGDENLRRYRKITSIW